MGVFENDNVKILWVISIQTETKIDHNNPSLTLLEKRRFAI